MFPSTSGWAGTGANDASAAPAGKVTAVVACLYGREVVPM